MEQYQRRRRRADEVKARASVPEGDPYCRVIGCGRPLRRSTTDGLDNRYCRQHADHYARHGSPFRGSYTAKQINPYRRAALDWIVANEDDPYVKNAIQRVQGLYQQAGPHVEAFRLRGKTARERAWAAWARLRKAGVDPRLPVAAWLAVEMITKDDPTAETKREYRQVQAAKIVHRMASGTHKRWEQEVIDRSNPYQPKVLVTKMDVYPRSRGRVLRHVGEDLEGAVELVAERKLEEVRKFMTERPPKDARARPRHVTARTRQAIA